MTVSGAAARGVEHAAADTASEAVARNWRRVVDMGKTFNAQRSIFNVQIRVP
jgi:hypothetical protein